MAASLVPKRGGPLSACAEGARERGLFTPAEAAQAAVAVLEQSLITVLLSSGLSVPILLLLGCGLRCCHLLLIPLLLSSLALVSLLFRIIPSAGGNSPNQNPKGRAVLTSQMWLRLRGARPWSSEQGPPTIPGRAGKHLPQCGEQERAQSSAIFLSGLDNRVNGGKLPCMWACLYWCLLWPEKQLPPQELVMFFHQWTFEGYKYFVSIVPVGLPESLLEKLG